MGLDDNIAPDLVSAAISEKNLNQEIWEKRVKRKVKQFKKDQLKELDMTDVVLHMDHSMNGVTIEQFSKLLKKSKSLTSLHGCSFVNGDEAEHLAGALKSNTSLIDLYVHGITEEGGKALGAGLKHNKSIARIVVLPFQDCQNIGIHRMLSGLYSSATLYELDLSNNKIDFRTASALGEVLRLNQSIQLLNLSSTSLNESCVEEISNGLQENSHLRKLNLSGNRNIGKIGFKFLYEGLKYNYHIHELNFEDTNMCEEGSNHVAKILIENYHVRHLNVSNNADGNCSWFIAEGLKENESLVYLDLSNTGLHVDAAKNLARALQVNERLEILHLSRNELDSQIIRQLSEGLKDNTGLVSLDLKGNSIDQLGIEYLMNALKVNKSLCQLNVEQTNIGNSGVEKLSLVLEFNETLEEIILDEEISVETKIALQSKLAKNRRRNYNNTKTYDNVTN